jgi:hypothetical protein
MVAMICCCSASSSSMRFGSASISFCSLKLSLRCFSFCGAGAIFFSSVLAGTTGADASFLF